MFAGYFLRRVRAAMTAPGTIHVRPSRGFASMMQDRERKRAMLSTMGRKRQVRSLRGWLYSLMPKFVLGSAKNERTQPHPQRPIDRNLHAGLRRARYRLSTQWCPANYTDPLAGGSPRHKMTRAQERGFALRRVIE